MTAPNSITIEDMEQQVETPPAQPSLQDIKLSGEGVPEELRDKSAAALIERLKAAEDALKLSEKARQDMQQQQFRQPEPVREPEPEPELTPDQLKEIYEEDPLRAMQLLTEQATKKAEKNLQARLDPIVTGTVSTAERAAKQRHALEFELFGDQIKKAINMVPGGAKAMSSDVMWDDLIAYVRGLPGNIDTIVERKLAERTRQPREEAQNGQLQSMGFSSTPKNGSSTRNAAGSGDEDPTEKEIRTRMGMTETEWRKWKEV